MKNWFKHPGNIDEPLTGAELTGLISAGTTLAVLQVVIQVFIAYFYTDVVGISAAAVGTLLLVTRVADGFTDLGMGVIISKTRGRWGQARPWGLRMAVPVLASVLLVFYIPESWDLRWKTIYACVTYFLMITVALTPAGLVGGVLGTNMTSNTQSRRKNSLISSLFVMAGSVAGNVVVLRVTGSGGDSFASWRRVALLFGILAFLGQLAQFLLTKERMADKTRDASEKTPLRKMLPALTRNKYFIIMCFVGMMGALDGAMAGSVLYYVKHVLNDADLVGVIAAVNLVFMAGGLCLTPVLCKKIPPKRLIMGGLLLKIITFALNLLWPANVPFFMAFSALRSLAGAPFMIYGGVYLLNTIEYGEYKTGIRANHLILSVSSVWGKIGSGLGGALIGWLLSLGGYSGAAAVQNPAAKNMIVNIYFFIPLLAAAAAFILLSFYDLDKKYDAVTEALRIKAEAG